MSEPEKILRIEQNIVWLPKPNESQIVLSALLPARKLVTTALALAFAGNHLLMTNLTSRGWDIPGGHVESGERPDETVRREVYEETGATLESLHLLGYQRLRLLGPKPGSYRYPYPDSYQAFYWAQVASLDDFLPTAEAQGRALFPPSKAQMLSWVRKNQDLYEVALQMTNGENEYYHR
jgi:8-oxo-dGTP pyrophosphatase MutT (NUDIX family)